MQSKNINLKNFCDFDQKLSHLKTSGPVNLWLRDRLWGLFPETQVPYVTPLLIVYTNSFELCLHFITPHLGKSSQEKSLQCTNCSCKLSIYEIENVCIYLKVIEKDAHVSVGPFTQQSNVQSVKQLSWMFYFMYTQGKVENRRQSSRVKVFFSANAIWNPRCMKGLVAKIQKKMHKFSSNWKDTNERKCTNLLVELFLFLMGFLKMVGFFCFFFFCFFVCTFPAFRNENMLLSNW